MLNLNFSSDNDGFISDPITAVNSSIVVHVEFASTERLTAERSITGNNYVPFGTTDKAEVHECTIGPLKADQKIRLRCQQEPTSASYLL